MCSHFRLISDLGPVFVYLIGEIHKTAQASLGFFCFVVFVVFVVCFFSLYFTFLHTTYNSHIILTFTLHYAYLHYLKQALLTIHVIQQYPVTKLNYCPLTNH